MLTKEDLRTFVDANIISQEAADLIAKSMDGRGSTSKSRRHLDNVMARGEELAVARSASDPMWLHEIAEMESHRIISALPDAYQPGLAPLYPQEKAHLKRVVQGALLLLLANEARVLIAGAEGLAASAIRSYEQSLDVSPVAGPRGDCAAEAASSTPSR